MIVLRAGNGAEAHILPFGAVLQALIVPDRNGAFDDIVLGHDDEAGYRARRDFFGATIGRYANRVAGRYAPNDGANTLHGGPDGFDRRDWTAEVAGASITLSLHSPDGDQGFPGALDAKVTYHFSFDGQDTVLAMEFEAVCDQPCPVNLTNHSFFNLGGNLRDPARMRSVMDHHLRIEAARYLPTDTAAIPLDPAPVEGTPFDFRKARRIGDGIRADHPQIVIGRGYDHNFCLDSTAAAELYDPVSGRRMRMVTDQPGLQFYSGNFLDGTVTGKGGTAYRMGDALCLEPQAWPDGPNRPDFPDTVLRPGETYRHRTELRFSAD